MGTRGFDREDSCQTAGRGVVNLVNQAAKKQLAIKNSPSLLKQ